jgi:hypothetical protein
MLYSQPQTLPIGTGELLFFPVLTTTPDWPHGMNDETSREIAGPSDDRLASWAPLGILLARLGHDARPSRPMNGPIHPASPSQATVGSIHNGVSVLGGDVSRH